MLSPKLVLSLIASESRQSPRRSTAASESVTTRSTSASDAIAADGREAVISAAASARATGHAFSTFPAAACVGIGALHSARWPTLSRD